MKPLRSILTAGIALALFSTGVRAETFPIFEDAAGSTVSNTIAKAAGAAKTLAVSARSTAFINFSVGSAGLDPATVTQARLVIYLPRASATGTLSIKNLTAGFTETIATRFIPTPTTGATLDTIDLAAIPLKGDFFISDITAQVKAWLADPNSEFGIAITSDGTATATLASKEGAASGHPAFIEVDVNRSGGTVAGTTATFTGAIASAGAELTGDVNFRNTAAGGFRQTFFDAAGVSTGLLNSAGLFYGPNFTSRASISYGGDGVGRVQVTGPDPANAGAYLDGNGNIVGKVVTADSVFAGLVSVGGNASIVSNGNITSNGTVSADNVSARLVATAGTLANSNSSFRFPNAVNVGTGGLWLREAFGPPQAAFIGSPGNFLSFGHQGVSEDCMSYANNTFYFRDSVDGGDTSDPNLNIGDGTFVGANATLFSSLAVGVTSATRARLEVGFALNSYSLPAANRVLGPGGEFTVGAGTYGAALFAAGDIVTSANLVAFSDARIKHSLGRSDATRDLAALRDIEITDYTYIDTIAYGDRRQKKVLAQQLERVLPDAVSRRTESIPDIYHAATAEDGWIALETDLHAGERVRLIRPDGTDGIHEVLEVKPGAFRTASGPASGELFVFGREVKDFRAVDYDAVAMLNVSATQELARKLDAKDTEIAALTQKLAALEARDQEREARLARLEGAAAPARATTASLQLK